MCRVRDISVTWPFLLAVCRSFCFLLGKRTNDARYERQEELSIEDGSEWDSRARWVKSSFSRQSRACIISEKTVSSTGQKCGSVGRATADEQRSQIGAFIFCFQVGNFDLYAILSETEISRI